MDWESALEPLLTPLNLSLYDVEVEAHCLNVVVNRSGGVDLEALTAANRAISKWLDEVDPIEGRFTLDVSSPGLERRLRSRAHFHSALGERVTLRERRDGLATRRLEGPLLAVGDEVVTVDDGELGPTEVALAAVERARTVFQWGPSVSSAPRAKSSSASRKG